MFYKMIENKCNEWYSSERCTVRNLIEYIEKTGQMRDAQIEAIKVYLFLKIGCECKPLEFLFRYGCFNSINLNDIEPVSYTHLDVYKRQRVSKRCDFQAIQLML